MSVDENRPPYVVFEQRDIEDRNASEAAGHYVSRSVHYAIVTRPGSRDTFEQEAEVWLKNLREKARQKQVPPNWYDAFKASFDAYVKGEEGPVSGTPLRDWPPISPAVRKTLLAAGIQSVEDLASLPDADFQNIGTGALSYKQKAIAWLAEANNIGKNSEKMASMQVQMEELIKLTREQAAEIKKLQAGQKAPI